MALSYDDYSSSSFASVARRWRNIRPAWLLAASILIGWIIGVIGDSFSVCPPSLSYSCYPATYLLAQNNALVIYFHQYYQIFTSILVTDSPLDAGFNAIAVLILDRLTYDTMNKSRYFLVFFLTAILGNLLTLLHGPRYASAGASGGIFGVFATILSYSWAQEKKIDIAALVFFIVVFAGSSILLGVNWIAHVGGAIGGFILGPALYFIDSKNHPTGYNFSQKSVQFVNVAVAVLLLILLFFSVVQFALFAGL